MKDTQVYIVLTTVHNEAEAERLARRMVEERLAACVNVVGPIRSFYEWQGALQKDNEWLLLAKTDVQHFAALQDFVLRHHSYEVPEVLALPVAEGSQRYLDWLLGVLGAANKSP